MNKLETRTAMSLAAVFAARMLGLFMILPILPLLAKDLSHSTPFLIGLCVGIYGLSQAPVISQWGGLSAVFWTTALLAFIGILLVAFVVPTSNVTKTHRDTGVLKAYIKPVLTQSTLLRMNLSVFALHLLMTANFAVLPLIFRDSLQLDGAEHWKIYLPVLFVSIVFSLPMIIISEKFRKTKIVFIIAVLLIVLSQLLLAFTDYTLYPLLFAFLLFFIGFNFLEAMQPSLVAKYSDVSAKGTAMGVYSTSQFLGIFVGGAVGGYILLDNYLATK